jgi:hypothetical protein
MPEPTIIMEFNDGTEGTPTWTAVDTALRWVGPDASDGDLTDPFPAGVVDADDRFFDDVASPDDGELWHETSGTDVQSTTAGRALNVNCIRVREAGGSDPTADPPVFTAYDDAADAGNRTNPTVAILAGTSGSSTISFIRAVETTGGAPAAGWGTQDHDSAPSIGEALDGDQSGERVDTAAILAASGNKPFQLAACAPHDSPTGLTSFVYALTYTFV